MGSKVGRGAKFGTGLKIGDGAGTVAGTAAGALPDVLLGFFRPSLLLGFRISLPSSGTRVSTGGLIGRSQTLAGGGWPVVPLPAGVRFGILGALVTFDEVVAEATGDEVLPVRIFMLSLPSGPLKVVPFGPDLTIFLAEAVSEALSSESGSSSPGSRPR